MMDPENYLLTDEILLGIDLINRGKFFDAHEILEKGWLQESQPVKQLYQGLIQVSVLLYHLERNNRKGASKLLPMAIQNLNLFGEIERPVNLKHLLTDLKRLQEYVDTSDKRINPPLFHISILVEK